MREHLLKEMQDTISVTDMLRMACVCEGTMHSKELSKQYLESILTQSGQGVLAKAEAIDIAKTNIGHSLKANPDQAPTVPIVAVAIPPNDVRLLAKNAITVIKEATFHNTAGLNNGEDHPPN